MSCFAIAAFVHNKEAIGARVINTENNNLRDLKNSDIMHLISKGYKFENLEVKDGKIRWSQGTFDRYPQIYASGAIDKPQVAIVMGEFSGETRKFKICNYEGKQIVIDEAHLLDHAQKFGIANCKKSHKDGTYFIQSISGELPKLKTETSFKYRADGTLIIGLPEDGSVTELQIPDMVGVIPIGNLEFIEVVPKSMGANIKKLALPKNTMHIKPSYFTRFPNLELLYIQNDRCIIYEYAFSNLTRLKKIIANGCAHVYYHACEGCTSLESFISKTTIEEIMSQTFKNCKSLNVQELLNNKILRLSGVDTFKGAYAEELTIRMGVSYFNLRAFENINGLTKITVEDPNTVINELNSASFKSDLHLYIKDRSVAIKNGIMGGSVISTNGKGKIFIDTIGFKDENINTKKAIAKAGMLIHGADSTRLKFSDINDCAIIIGGMPEKDIKNFIINVCNRHVRGWSYSSSVTEQLGEYQIEVGVYSYKDPAMLRKTTEVEIFDEALVYSNKKVHIIVPLNKQFILDYLEVPNDTSYYKNNTFWLAKFAIPNRGKIDSILYKDGSLHVTFRNKAVEIINPHDRK